MKFLYNFELIDYDCINSNSAHTILFLHGWGGNKNSFISSINLLKSSYNILTITMPTIYPTVKPWNMLDYCNLVQNIMLTHNIKSVIIVCHSFGFRVACLLNGIVHIEKIVVTAGAGLKRINNFKRIETQNNIILLKNPRFKYLFNSLASDEYKSLSKMNKQTFKNVVNTINNRMIKFSCPMFLFWGSKDGATPLWMGKKIYKENEKFYNTKLKDEKPFRSERNKIKENRFKSKNIVVKKSGKDVFIITKSDHFAYINMNAIFFSEMKKFLRG